jgi:hypothetical protein
MHTELRFIAAKLDVADCHRRIARAPHAQDLPRRSMPKVRLGLIRRRHPGRDASTEPLVRAVSPADLVR